MIAAAPPNQDRVLETFKLVLLLVSKGSDCPERLKRYFRDIITEASDLIDDTENAAGKARPESVVLALKLSLNDNLRSHLLPALAGESFTKEAASLALEDLERSNDPHSQLANFSKEIHTVI